MRLGQVLAQHAAYRTTWDTAYAERLCQALDLRLDRRVRALSKGEFRRAQLVCALAHRPRALILDEPTDGLDPLIRSRVQELLAGHLADSPATVIVSTHQVHEMNTLADRVAVLHRGQLVEAMTTEELHATVRQILFVRSGGPPPLAGAPIRIVRQESRASEHRWTVVGDVSEAIAWLRTTGAEVVEERAMDFEEAAVVLLAASAATEAA